MGPLAVKGEKEPFFPLLNSKKIGSRQLTAVIDFTAGCQSPDSTAGHLFFFFFFFLPSFCAPGGKRRARTGGNAANGAATLTRTGTISPA